MKVELKQIVDQLSEACNLDKNHKVSALIDTLDDTIVGWTIVEIFDDVRINSINDLKFNSIKELFQAYV